MRDWAVEDNVAAFSMVFIAFLCCTSSGRLAEASTTSNSTNLMSYCLAEKVDECPLNQGC